MEPACHPRLRRAALAIAGAAVALVATLGAASQADASQYVVPDPTLKVKKVVAEGGTAVAKTRLSCPFPECTYTLKTAPGTAKVDGKDAGRKDYNPFAYKTITLQKGQVKPVALKILTLRDGVCEKDEYFSVKLEGEWLGVNDRYGGPAPVEKQAKITIKGNGNLCRVSPPIKLDPKPTPLPAPKPAPAPQPQPAPQPAPAPVPDPGPQPNTNDDGTTNGQQVNSTFGSTTIARCVTNLAAGVQGQGGAWGHFVSGCSVKLTCPVSVRVCKASEESRINLEFYRDENVTMNSRIRVFSASNTQFFHRDVSCANTNWCAVEDTVMIRGGESASVECNGVRQSTQGNRARNTCQLSLESLNS